MSSTPDRSWTIATGESGEGIPLTFVAPGRRVRIRNLLGGSRMCARLAALGLFPGVEVRVLSGSAPGPVLIARDNCRIAIGCGMADRVIVEPVDSDVRSTDCG